MNDSPDPVAEGARKLKMENGKWGNKNSSPRRQPGDYLQPNKPSVKYGR